MPLKVRNTTTSNTWSKYPQLRIVKSVKPCNDYVEHANKEHFPI